MVVTVTTESERRRFRNVSDRLEAARRLQALRTTAIVLAVTERRKQTEVRAEEKADDNAGCFVLEISHKEI